MAWTRVQGKSFAVVGVAGPISGIQLVLTSAPTQGNLVAIGVAFGSSDNLAVTISSIKDLNNNFYTLSPSSPSSYNTIAKGMVWLAYLAKAPANASATITVTFSGPVGVAGGINYVVFADEFSVEGGAVFITDAVKNSGDADVAGNVISNLSILLSDKGALFYSVVTAGNIGTVSGIGNPYTHAADMTVANGGWQWGEYNMNAGPGTVAVNYTTTNIQQTDKFNALAMTFVPGADIISVFGVLGINIA